MVTPTTPMGPKAVDDEPLGFETSSVNVCGLGMKVLRRRSDFFAAVAGDLPIKSTGLVLWECAELLADYLGYARWIVPETGAPWWQVHPPAPVVPSQFWPRRTVLELGGGCGLVSAALASFGAHVLCTDGDNMALKTAARNAAEAKRHHRAEDARRTGSETKRPYSDEWGHVDFCHLAWGDREKVQKLIRERDPFEYVVGSDLLYGDKSPPEPLVETLAAIVEEPRGRDVEVILAVKNRMADEVAAFQRAAEERHLWEIRLADPDELLEGFDVPSAYGGSGRAYSIIHMTVSGKSIEPPTPKRARIVAADDVAQ